MRKTLSIDDDLGEPIEQFQRQNSLPFKQAINRLLRSGLLETGSQPNAMPYEGPVFEAEINPSIDVCRLNQYVDELDIEEFGK